MLEQLFGSRTRAKLLHIFFHNPEQSFYVRELARVAGIQLNGIRRELANLESMGVVAAGKKEEGSSGFGLARSRYYKLNGASLLYHELKALIFKARMLEEQELVEILKQKAGRLSLFLLTGVFTESKDAETDILLVGSIKPMVVARLMNDFEKKLGRAVRYTVMNDKEFRERNEIGDKFLYSIFEGKNIVIVDELTSVPA